MMLNYDYLREALYQIFMIGLCSFLSVGFAVMICDALKAPVNRLLRRAVQKYERKQDRRRKASTFIVENIPGTNGYRIKGR